MNALIAIELIESIKKDDLEATKLNVDLFNNTFNFPNSENIGFYDVLPLSIFSYGLENHESNKSLYYTLDNIKGIPQEDVERIKWNLKVNSVDNPDKIHEFISDMLSDESKWINDDYKVYSLIRLISINQDYDSLILIKQKLLNKKEN